jgi:hypothetical protein
VTSLNPDRLLVSASASALGQTSAAVTSGGPFHIQGLTADGPAQVRVQAPGYDDLVLTVDFLPVSLQASTLSSLDMRPGASTTLTLGFRLLDANRYIDWSGGVRPGVTVPVSLRVLDDSIARLAPTGSMVFQNGGPSQFYIQLSTLNPGDTAISIEAPPDTPLKASRIPVHVLNWLFGLSSSMTVGRSLMVPVSVSNPRPDEVSAAVSSEGDATVLIGTDRFTPGRPSLVVSIPGRSSRVVFVEGPAQGNTGAISVSASGFDTARGTIQVTDPMVTLSGIGTLQAGGGLVNALVALGIESFSQSEQPLGVSQAPITIRVRSSDPAVVRAGSDSLQFMPGESARTLTLQPGHAGAATVTLEAPPGFNPPSGIREFILTVR